VPRAARKKSETGVYHVTLRGINQQQIFEDEEDNEKFLQIMEECKKVSGFELYAFCLMGNHIHLLLKVVAEDVDQIIKRIGVRYVFWYNWKYQRAGHLFQDRFKSEPVENDRYLLAVVRYIHQNPIKANICDRLEDYRWSSFNEYVGSRRIADCDAILEIIGMDEFLKLNKTMSNDSDIDDYTPRVRVTDDEARATIIRICNFSSFDDFRSITRKERDLYLSKIKNCGISIRQISRLTGVSKAIVERA